jgi:hypothetical protein
MIELPKPIEEMLLSVLLNSREANAILKAFAAGKELTGNITLKGTFSLDTSPTG